MDLLVRVQGKMVNCCCDKILISKWRLLITKGMPTIARFYRHILNINKIVR